MWSEKWRVHYTSEPVWRVKEHFGWVAAQLTFSETVMHTCSKYSKKTIVLDPRLQPNSFPWV